MYRKCMFNINVLNRNKHIIVLKSFQHWKKPKNNAIRILKTDFSSKCFS